MSMWFYYDQYQHSVNWYDFGFKINHKISVLIIFVGSRQKLKGTEIHTITIKGDLKQVKWASNSCYIITYSYEHLKHLESYNMTQRRMEPAAYWIVNSCV